MSQENSPPGAISRRKLLQGIGILSLSALTASFFPAIKAQAQEMNSSGFVPVSAFLVSRPVNPILAQRYYNALIKQSLIKQAVNKNEPDFPSQLAALNRYISTHHFAHVDDFIASTQPDDPLYKTAIRLVSAWYTGVVGDDENMELIAYADAMMYLPTQGILVIPTYGSGPDTWGSKPVYPSSNKGSHA